MANNPSEAEVAHMVTTTFKDVLDTIHKAFRRTAWPRERQDEVVLTVVTALIGLVAERRQIPATMVLGMVDGYLRRGDVMVVRVPPRDSGS